MCYSYFKTKTTSALFDSAIRRGLWKRLVRKFKRQPTRLDDFNQLRWGSQVASQSDRGIETIPIKHIVGTLGRVNEFDRDFMPLNNRVETRWRRILRLLIDGVPLPPIDVYRVKDNYYVIDGNHRVSASTFLGIEYVDAHIIELRQRQSIR